MVKMCAPPCTRGHLSRMSTSWMTMTASGLRSSLSRSQLFSDKKAWVSMVPIVKNGNVICAHHSKESRANCNEENNTNKTPPQTREKGRPREAPGSRFPMDIRLHTTSRKEDLIFSMAMLGYMASMHWQSRKHTRDTWDPPGKTPSSFLKKTKMFWLTAWIL